MCALQEGKQASLAADFSITQFKHLGRLLMVHGRNSYKRSAALSQFVIHRSLCISTMQVCSRGDLSESHLFLAESRHRHARRYRYTWVHRPGRQATGAFPRCKHCAGGRQLTFLQAYVDKAGTPCRWVAASASHRAMWAWQAAGTSCRCAQVCCPGGHLCVHLGICSSASV